MERQHQQGSGRNERHGDHRERMRGLGGEWYGRDARGQSRHQRWTGDQDRDYSASGDLWDEDLGDYAGYGDYSGGRDESWASPEYRRRQGRGEREFSRSQRYRSGGDQSSFRTGSRYGDYGEYGDLAGGSDTRSGAYRNYGSLRNSGRSTGSYGDSGFRSGESGWRGDGGLGRGYRGDYESAQRSQPYRYGSRYGDSGDSGYGGRQSFRGRGPKNYMRSDDRIREDLNEQLMDADDVDASDVSIEVKDGVVTLSGSVEQRWIKHRIEDMADDCSGVKDVRNEIRVQSRSDWPYDKQQVGGGLGSTASSQGTSATSGGLSSSSRSQTGTSAH
jgi:osmotically-inducible protein OsmY